MAEWHHNQLSLHCRICGGRLKKSRSARAGREYLYSNLQKEIQDVFGVIIANDQKEVHPTSMCRSCNDTIAKKLIPSVVFEWQQHSEECKVS